MQLLLRQQVDVAAKRVRRFVVTVQALVQLADQRVYVAVARRGRRRGERRVERLVQPAERGQRPRSPVERAGRTRRLLHGSQIRRIGVVEAAEGPERVAIEGDALRIDIGLRMERFGGLARDAKLGDPQCRPDLALVGPRDQCRIAGIRGAFEGVDGFAIP